MRVDFYQLSRGPVERVVAMLSSKVLDSGARLLVVSDDEVQRKAISKALWSGPAETFLANGMSGEPNAECQPILLSADVIAGQDRSIAIIADGNWRDGAEAFDRVLLMFDETATQRARELWRSFDGKDDSTKDVSEDVERHIFKQQPDGRWQEGG